MGNLKKIAIGALGWGLVAAFFTAGGWFAWRLLGGGVPSPITVGLGARSSAAWARRLPLISIPGDKPLARLPNPIQIGVAGNRPVHPPLIDLPGRQHKLVLPLIDTGLLGNALVAGGHRRIAPVSIAAGNRPDIPTIPVGADETPPIPTIALAPPAAVTVPIINLQGSGGAPDIPTIHLGELAPQGLNAAPLARTISTIHDQIESLRYDDDILDADQQQRKYAESMCVDQQGKFWVGCIDTGIWRCSAGTWTQFTTKDGLGDNNCYALACDRKGRIWAGSGGSGTGGVSVYNGQKWQNYGVIGGLNTPSPGTSMKSRC